MEEMKTELLTIEKVEGYWGQIEEQLDLIPQVWDRWWTKADLRIDILEGRVQVWGTGTHDAIHLVTLSCLVLYPANRTLNAFLAFGNNLDACLPSLVATLQRFAAMRGCTLGQVMGRKGWEKKLEAFGFSYGYSVMTIPIRTEMLQ